jgi:tRNA G18 (ribose-2'-O)-methylase SpoU
MSKIDPTSTFLKYELNDDEKRIAHLFTQENIYGIKNLIAQAAEEKITLKFDPDKVMAFVQREAELQGQINILNYLLQLHEETINNALADQQNNPSTPT